MFLSGKRRMLRSRYALLFVMLATGLAGCLPEKSQSLLPVATVRNLMVGVTIPASNVVFRVASDRPENDADWQEVQINAQALADAGARLRVGVRGAGKEDWLRLAQAMADGAGQAAQAAARRDGDAVVTAGNEIYAACEGCHQLFLKKDAGAQAPDKS